ncbi:MAG: rhodanese-like domain-containing protein [Methanomicrobiaceae archaeon]|nr:rhodanese-like domain-containing protein [Methanomicrobiaceae archaeon]
MKLNVTLNNRSRAIPTALVSLVLLLAVVFSACMTSTSPSAPPTSPGATSIRTVNVYEAHFLVEKFGDDEDFAILDIRRVDESAEPYIQGAVLYIYQSEEFIEAFDSLDKEGNYLVYTSKTISGENIRQLFRFLGFKKIFFLNDGVAAWRSAGYPVVYPGFEANITPGNLSVNISNS